MSTFPKFLLQNQRKNPGAPAIREKRLGIWHTLSWGQLADEVRVVAAALLLEGVQCGAAGREPAPPILRDGSCPMDWRGGSATLYRYECTGNHKPDSKRKYRFCICREPRTS